MFGSFLMLCSRLSRRVFAHLFFTDFSAFVPLPPPLLKTQAYERRGGGVERPAAEHLRPDEGSEPAAVLPAHPGKMPTSVCGAETATTKASASTISGPEPLQTPGTQESS